jgi:hypothetical protein
MYGYEITQKRITQGELTLLRALCIPLHKLEAEGIPMIEVDNRMRKYYVDRSRKLKPLNRLGGIGRFYQNDAILSES